MKTAGKAGKALRGKSPPPQATPGLPETGSAFLCFGEGLGKSTICMGFMLRALTRGWPVLLICFSECDEAELSSVRQLGPGIAGRLAVVRVGQRLTDADRRKAEAVSAAIGDGWEIGVRAALSGRYRMIVMDGISDVLSSGRIAPADARQFLAARAPELSLVLTGRQAPPEIIGLFDQVSEIRPIR